MKKITPTSLKKSKDINPSLDFKALREQGIGALQQLTGDKWTDYNLHDPGVTILEQLCYAITELAYKTEFSIHDLLAGEDGIVDLKNNAFYQKKEILTSGPVTINDYRKVIVDQFKEIQNVWLQPSLPVNNQESFSGLYKVVVQLKNDLAIRYDDNDQYKADLKKRLSDFLNESRNLCEDFEDFIILQPQKINVNADIIVDGKISSEKLLAKIYSVIELHFNNPLTFHTERDLLQKGYTIEEIYEGPAMSKGFLLDKELMPRRMEIDLTEITSIISQIPEVLNVQSISVMVDGQAITDKSLPLAEDKYPLLDIGMDAAGQGSSIRLLKENYTMVVRTKAFKDALIEINELSMIDSEKSFLNYNQSKTWTGTFRNPGKYHSIQHDFPLIYGISNRGLSLSDTPERQAKAMQLKAYLMFFEQILANYLEQLANVENIFSIDLTQAPAQSYFTQALDDVPGMEQIINYFTPANESSKSRYINRLKMLVETEAQFLERKNRVLDHLLARFDESINKHQAVMYEKSYDTPGNDTRTKELLKWKADLLNQYVDISYNRAQGFNYTVHTWGSNNISGLEKKMAVILGIRHHEKKLFSDVFGTAHASVAPAGRQREIQYDRPVQRTLDWIQGEININDYLSLYWSSLNPGLDTPRYEFLFINRTQTQLMHILKEGINRDNYLVGPDKENRLWLLVFKSGEEENWTVVSKHSSEDTAKKAQRQLIKQLKEISLQSEGFHLVEHILLRPLPTEPVYGFNLPGRKQDEIFLNHYQLQDYEHRNATVKELIETGTDAAAYHITFENDQYRIVLHGKGGILAQSPKTYPSREEATNDISNMVYCVKSIKNNPADTLYGFKLNVLLPHNDIVDESFFNFQATIIIPAWPARFQDPDFLKYIKNLFSINAAAHIRLHFKVLNITGMRSFEALYSDWVNLMKNNPGQARKNSVNYRLIHFLKHHN